jgi:hypothetical protein
MGIRDALYRGQGRSPLVAAEVGRRQGKACPGQRLAQIAPLAAIATMVRRQRTLSRQVRGDLLSIPIKQVQVDAGGDLCQRLVQQRLQRGAITPGRAAGRNQSAKLAGEPAAQQHALAGDGGL